MHKDLLPCVGLVLLALMGALVYVGCLWVGLSEDLAAVAGWTAAGLVALGTAR